MKKKTIEKSCPCTSGETYHNCCEKYHLGAMVESPVSLMRSRFSAYALNLPNYIIDTTHPASNQYVEDRKSWVGKLSHFSRSTHFEKLQVLGFQEFDTVATVSFTAHLFQHWQNTTFTEKSTFEKFHGKWLYRSGILIQGNGPNLITNSQNRILPLAYLGEKVLRQKAEPILEITLDIRRLVDEMVETMDGAYGMGLAAPQVHHSIRLFIIRTPIEKEDGGLDLGEVKVFINPILSDPSPDTWKTDEGCLSIPTIRADVIRPKEITVEYTNLEGKQVTERLSGMQARVVQHENDHINGILFIDQLGEEEKKALAPILEKLQQRIHLKPVM